MKDDKKEPRWGCDEIEQQWAKRNKYGLMNYCDISTTNNKTTQITPTITKTTIIEVAIIKKKIRIPCFSIKHIKPSGGSMETLISPVFRDFKNDPIQKLWCDFHPFKSSTISLFDFFCLSLLFVLQREAGKGSGCLCSSLFHKNVKIKDRGWRKGEEGVWSFTGQDVGKERLIGEWRITWVAPVTWTEPPKKKRLAFSNRNY